MINLLPQHAEKKLSQEYWLRVGAVWAFLFSILFILLSALLLPTYILVHSQFQELAIADQKNTEIEGKFQNAQAQIKSANVLAEVLSQTASGTKISTVIDEVKKAQTQNIQIKTLEIGREEGFVNTVQIQGEAQSRASLVQFKTALEGSALFESASVPLSDLARDTKLSFTITATIQGAKVNKKK